MALSNLLGLIDDIAGMTKLTAQKTASIVTDDIAVSAEQVSGFDNKREIPVILAVAKGSLVNKVILVPLALLLSAFAPFLITPLLLAGGLYLAYEGVEKIIDYFYKQQESSSKAPLANEKHQIKGAIRTDFVLSIEIIVIALSSVEGETLILQAVTLSIVAITITIAIYGLVALIVKIDDLGFYLNKQSNKAAKKLGNTLLILAPHILKGIALIGTIAMLLVAGNIYWHHGLSELSWMSSLKSYVEAPSLEFLMYCSLGALLGLFTTLLITIIRFLKGRTPTS